MQLTLTHSYDVGLTLFYDFLELCRGWSGMRMHITPFEVKQTFHLITLMAISMAECLVANQILYCYYYCNTL